MTQPSAWRDGIAFGPYDIMAIDYWDWFEEFDGEPWHVGQSYEDEPARPLRCTTCGGTQFAVAQGSYFTALRCPTCGWEACIHNG